MKRFTSEASHQAIQSWATVASTLLAFGALIYSTISYQNTVHMSSRDQAKRDWSEFLAMTGENPDLSFDSTFMIRGSDQEAREFDNRYDAFMDRMYFYMNSVVESDGVDNWKLQIETNLGRYGTKECSLGEGMFRKRFSNRGYSTDFVSLIEGFYVENCARLLKESRDRIDFQRQIRADLEGSDR